MALLSSRSFEPAVADAKSGHLPLSEARGLEEKAHSLLQKEKQINGQLDEQYDKVMAFCQEKFKSFSTLVKNEKTSLDLIDTLQTSLSGLSERTEALTSQIRRLHRLRGRLTETVQLVGDILDLRTCAETAQKAIAEGNFELAAKQVAKHRSLQEVTGDGSSPSAPASAAPGAKGRREAFAPSDEATLASLRQSEQQLTAIVRREFDAAINANDRPGVSRFAKLFYPLGLQNEGIARYTAFLRKTLADACNQNFRKIQDPFKGTGGVVQKVKADDAEAAGPVYAEAMTQVFVLIADTIQEHQQNIEEEFGPANFVLFLRGLYEEADAQGRRVMDKFIQEKASILSLQLNPATDSAHAQSNSGGQAGQQGGAGGGGDSALKQKELRLVGLVLREAALLSFRIKQFDSYMRRNAKQVIDAYMGSPGGGGGTRRTAGESPGGPEGLQSPQSLQGGAAGEAHATAEMTKTMEELMAAGNCDPHSGLPQLGELQRRAQDLMGTFVSLEQYLMFKQSQFAMVEYDRVDWEDDDDDAPGGGGAGGESEDEDEMDFGSGDNFTSTLVDDVFFILAGSIDRAISTSDVVVVCSVINHVSALISTDLKQRLLDNLGESKRLYQVYIQDWDHVRRYRPKEMIPDPALLPAAARNRGHFGAAFSWVHSIGNVQASISNVLDLKKRSQRGFQRQFEGGTGGDGEGEGSPGEGGETETHGRSTSHAHGRRRAEGRQTTEQLMFQHCLQTLDSAKADLEAIHSIACRDTLNMLRCHINPILAPLDSFEYTLSPEDFARFQVEDPIFRRFISVAQTLVKHLRKALPSPTVREILLLFVDRVTKRVEQAVLSKRFSLHGALQLDSDVRQLGSFFASALEQSVRGRFARLNDIGTLLNLETVREFEDIFAGGAAAQLRLSPEEVQQVLSLRVDFAQADVAAAVKRVFGK